MSRDACQRLCADRWVVWDGGGREVVARCGEVSRGRSTGGVVVRREGPNAKPSVRTFVLVVVALTAANPCVGPGREGRRVKPEDARPERSSDPAPDDTAAHPAEASLWEQVFSRENLAKALRRVEQNTGAAGIDGIAPRSCGPGFTVHWPEVRSQLDAGTYRPRPARRVMIPKPSGGERMLGVPAVTSYPRSSRQSLGSLVVTSSSTQPDSPPAPAARQGRARAMDPLAPQDRLPGQLRTRRRADHRPDRRAPRRLNWHGLRLDQNRQAPRTPRAGQPSLHPIPTKDRATMPQARSNSVHITQ